MPAITIVLGIVLIILGVGSCIGRGMTSWTALIPAMLGVLFLLLGMVATNRTSRAGAMRIAVLLGVLAFIGAPLRPIGTLARGEEFTLSTAVMMQLVTAALCLVFVILCVASFIRARRDPAGGGV